ncbi:hypothetical protein PRZ48_005709 [Zasmidium cellare]|uniref:SET domain-containing protein n=1 Tax=Zasmidium cellare TaxID=395010 RepID=A0ABR0EL26_ZASCE|nr:hypothetical protein PRZ48_005709 [Zasmidium cellare]
MEQQIRDLCKGLGDVDVVRVGSNNATNFQHLIARLSTSAPALQGHHPPSGYESVDTLQHTYFEQLQQDQRLSGFVLHATVTGLEYKHGALIAVQDERGASGFIWSLLLRPFGIPISEGMHIEIKEPYYGKCPTGDLAVCVHHPADLILVDPHTAMTKPAPAATPTCSSHNNTIRPSPLGGRGVFATARIDAGGLVLLEKALALAARNDAAAYGPGVEGILQGERTNGRKLALLQQLVDRLCRNGQLHQKFFHLHAGQLPTSSDPVSTPLIGPFDTYRALSIIRHNAHTIFPGNTSDHHDIANKATRSANPSTNDQTPGIWLHASMFNHSCLPNCTWAWTGDLFIARANRDIAIDEELTVAYVPTSYDYEKRRGVLRASNDFECCCPLCEADQAATRTPEIQDAVAKAQRLPQHVKGADYQERVKKAEELVQSAGAAYPRSIYADACGAELPRVQLAEPLYHLAHVVLDRARNGHNWVATSVDMRVKARIYFTACVEVGLGYILVLDQQSPYCELILRKHSQPRPIGVLALMALAELAFTDGDKARCRALKACAKQLYGMWYGEDASFKKQHLYYSCKDEPAEKGTIPASKEWEELKAASMAKSNMPPKLDRD